MLTALEHQEKFGINNENYEENQEQINYMKKMKNNTIYNSILIYFK